uniref:hypothetical protein n=1 Tax=Rhodococcus qingshengii TaxID=334542 RepID=UPI00211A731B|nr:hypothetical protein [Rhodococcus qingshengii]
MAIPTPHSRDFGSPDASSLAGGSVREAFTAEGKTKAMGVAMFERFTDSARRILILATYAASTRQCE